MEPNDVIERILELGRQKGYKTPSALAAACGLGREYFRGVKSRQSIPKFDTLLIIANKLETTPEYLLYGDNNQNHAENKTEKPLTAITPEINSTIPVLGMAAGAIINGAQGFVLSAAPVAFVPRPSGMKYMIDAYAIFVEGNSMDPAHPHGEIRFVNPRRTPTNGDSVIIQTQAHKSAPLQSFIAIYEGDKGSQLMFRKLKPASEISISKEIIRSVHKVLTLNEVIGI